MQAVEDTSEQDVTGLPERMTFQVAREKREWCEYLNDGGRRAQDVGNGVYGTSKELNMM